ncbi:cytochrome c [Maritimibacter alkaliphilus]|uniref:cytochrome c n=1 Tax=Maritimibacter alkaliphilus TaxID=404236 RepID=UPI001C9503C2|nr:cytochrome c [Maritimibacter alkaliphilus]MBY6089849.1 cytochrome c [Maritimibacter alkaliphilus]
MKTAALTLALLAGLGTAGTAFGQDAAKGAMEARKSVMHIYAYNLGILSGIAKGEAEYDSEIAMTAASNLATASSIDLTYMFPEGSEVGALEGSEAAPAALTDASGVMEKQMALHEAAAELEAAAGEGAEAIGAALRTVGGACGACHKAYRQKP